MIASATIVAFAILVSCKEPTQIVIEARTNVPHASGLVTTFTVGAPGQVEKADPTTESSEPWGPDGFVGSLVVVPGSSDDASLAVKLVMGVARDARACVAPSYQGCIVARRRLRYAPHEKLRLPIMMFAQCQDVPCDELSTCSVLGQCVPIEPACNDGTCELAGEGGGSASDASTNGEGGGQGDAAIDGPFDATPDGGGLDAASEGGGEGGTVGSVDCPGAPNGTCSKAGNLSCCIDGAGTNAACTDDIGTCLSSGRRAVICDDDADCPGQLCCHYMTGSMFSCQATCDRQMGFERVCHGDGACANGEKCTKLVFGHYLVCEP